MLHRQFWSLLTVAVFWAGSLSLEAAPLPTRAVPADMAEFRTVDKAVTTRISLTAPNSSSPQMPYLGVHLDQDKTGQLVVGHVEPDSPAAKAGIQKHDVVRQVEGKPLASTSALRELLQSRTPGAKLKLAGLRGKQPLEWTVPLGTISRPATIMPRAIMGITSADVKDGLRIDQVFPGLPASKAGLKPGDLLLKVNGAPVANTGKLTQLLQEKKPGDTVALTVKRDGKDMEIKVTLVAEPGRRGRRWGGGWDNRLMQTWRKDVYRLAVVPIEYPDVKHNEKVTIKDWERALFSKNSYADKSPTGQKVFGSLNDYYLEQSCDTFHIEGKVFDFLAVSKKRAEYGQGNRFALFNEALDKLLARGGKEALKNFDGLFFLYAGKRAFGVRGGIYWPHRATLRYQGKWWPYFICPEGGPAMASISVVAHEFGHMLGLPDLYPNQEKPEGLGVWCTMSVGHGEDGKPLHLSAWCKEKLGWIKPALVDPRVKQKLILAPIEKSSKECYKVLIQPDGSEYLLLENRVARSFDRDLPGQGLLIWRVVKDRPTLEESHGILGPEGPTRFLDSVPYPSTSNNAFTPYTTPSSKGIKDGGLAVHITNIQKLTDGRILFFIGYEYL
jgi:M6 family metalloprotease-like protein